MNENKKKTSSKFEVFREEMQRRREEMKKTLCSQIDVSFETSVDGLLNHVTKFLNSVKPNETVKNNSTCPDQLGSKRSAEIQNQDSVPHKKMFGSYNLPNVPSDVSNEPPIDLRFDPRANPQSAPQFAPQIVPRVDPRTDPRIAARVDPRYDPRQDPRYDPFSAQFQAQNNFRPGFFGYAPQNPHNDPRLDPNCDPRYASRFNSPNYRDNMPMNYGTSGTPYNQPIQPQNANMQYQNMNRGPTPQQPVFFIPPPNSTR